MHESSKKFPFIVIPAIILPLAVFHAVATYWHLYFHISWLDIPVHVIGGFWVGYTALAIYYHTNVVTRKRVTFFRIITLSLGSAIALGVTLELFEFIVAQEIARTPFDVFDTLSDVGADIVGGLFAGVFYLLAGYNREQ